MRIHQPKYNPLTCVPVCGHAWNSRRQAAYAARAKLTGFIKYSVRAVRRIVQQ